MNKDTRTYAIIAGAILIVAAIAVGTLFYINAAVPTLQYTNTTYGLSFKYPESYQLDESDTTGRHTITLTDKAALAASTTASEGPTTITVDIFPNAKNLTPSQWVKTMSASRYALSPDGTLASSTEAGKEAVAYLWDGLYSGESFVFANQNSIDMFSVTYINPQDRIKKDFDNLLLTVELQ